MIRYYFSILPLQVLTPGFSLKNFPALYQAYDQYHQGDYQQNMDQVADVKCEKPKSPQNNQNC